MRSGVASDSWKWWCGGGVIALAMVVGGFATWTALRVESGSSQEGHVRKPSMVEKPGDPHNGGKARLPVEVSIDGQTSIALTSASTQEVTLQAEADLTDVTVEIRGLEGLEGVSTDVIAVGALAVGQSRQVSVSVPARNGGLAVHLAGVVNGTPMTSSFEIKVSNPKAQALFSSSATVERDSLGQLVQPSKAD